MIWAYKDGIEVEQKENLKIDSIIIERPRNLYN